LPEPDPELTDAPALAVASGLVMSGSGAGLASSSPLNPPPPPLAKPKPRKISQVASKIGHARLTIDPTAAPYRVRLPPTLQRIGQSFDATVNICVAASGRVAGVKFLDSAGPMIDHHLSKAVARWSYRPLLESGRAVPFCYVLRYEFAGR
jgi:hypothetical protein